LIQLKVGDLHQAFPHPDPLPHAGEGEIVLTAAMLRDGECA
jgi:hypothetical protein